MEKPDIHPSTDPESRLEQAFIDEFLQMRGVKLDEVGALPEAERRRLLSAACAYAAVKLAEVEARAHYIHEIHGVHGEW